jgi:hypothetical protein
VYSCCGSKCKGLVAGLDQTALVRAFTNFRHHAPQLLNAMSHAIPPKVSRLRHGTRRNPPTSGGARPREVLAATRLN